jgi:cytochrome-b5 reductase
MPNLFQVLFLASFFITFAVLLALSNIFSSKLQQAGYDISRLILIGLSPSENTHFNEMSTSAPFLGQAIALLLAVVSGAFIYFKFSRSGTLSLPTYVRHPLTPAAI